MERVFETFHWSWGIISLPFVFSVPCLSHSPFCPRSRDFAVRACSSPALCWPGAGPPAVFCLWPDHSPHCTCAQTGNWGEGVGTGHFRMGQGRLEGGNVADTGMATECPRSMVTVKGPT